jgi:DNA-binding response OmpR family regulator
VLLVEDEATIRDLVREELVRAGYRVLALENGGDALLVLQSEQPVDLLLTDVGLPGTLNGRQVADAGRSQRPDLKVLFITGYADSVAFREGTMPAGMAVITKPFAIADMLLKVKAMVGRA